MVECLSLQPQLLAFNLAGLLEFLDPTSMRSLEFSFLDRQILFQSLFSSGRLLLERREFRSELTKFAIDFCLELRRILLHVASLG